MTTQFLPWKEQVAAWTDAARQRESQVRQMLSDFTARCEQIPGEIATELRRRVNLLDLATKDDVLEAQRRRDEVLLRTLRAEIREQLETFAAVIDDDLFASETKPAAPERAARTPVDLDFLDDEDDPLDDESGLVEYYGMRLSDGDDDYDEDEFDLADGTGRPTT